MKYFLVFTLTLAILTGCRQEPADSDQVSKSTTFRQLLKKLNPVDLPLKIVVSDFSEKPLGIFLEPTSIDTLFFDLKNWPIHAYGYYPDTTEFFKIIYYKVSDGPFPCLAVFNKNFEKMSDEAICVCRCGPGPCFKCSSYAFFQADNSLLAIDTLITLKCDSNYNSGPVDKMEIISLSGQINKDGSITLTEKTK